MYALYQQNRDLIAIGAYQHGSDPRVDEAIRLWPKLQHFLQQDIEDAVSMPEAMSALNTLCTTV
jgi:flagellum-specific ATP synthase